jgi:hypothetical protein
MECNTENKFRNWSCSDSHLRACIQRSTHIQKIRNQLKKEKLNKVQKKFKKD